jgi:hypothetical protein
MNPKIEKLFRSPYSVPNGLQVTDEGVWIVDQITDRVALVELTESSDYGVTKLTGTYQPSLQILADWRMVEIPFGWLLTVQVICGDR